MTLVNAVIMVGLSAAWLALAVWTWRSYHWLGTLVVAGAVGVIIVNVMGVAIQVNSALDGLDFLRTNLYLQARAVSGYVLQVMFIAIVWRFVRDSIRTGWRR